MIVVQINATSGQGSTGRIVEEISKQLDSLEIENYILYSLGKTKNAHAFKISNKLLTKINSLFAHLFGNNGFEDVLVTRRIIKFLNKTKPTIVHLHNVHSHDINLKKLFKYLNKTNIKVFWTFHDCWAFTGYCYHFDYISCNKWAGQCANCPLYKQFSLIADRSHSNFVKKKKFLLENREMTIITPSTWLADNVKKSFLKKKNITTIHNGINLQDFHFVSSDFLSKNSISDKIILLFVAYKFTEKKGLNDVLFLSERLPKNYQIIMVGDIDIGLIRGKSNILHISKIDNITTLCELYSCADIFVNPTYEDTLPTTNIESLACGTPVISYSTGGAPETIDETCGILVDRGNKDKLLNEILSFNKDEFTAENCIKKAYSFDSMKAYAKYVKLYLESEENELKK